MGDKILSEEVLVSESLVALGNAREMQPLIEQLPALEQQSFMEFISESLFCSPIIWAE